MCSKDCPCRKCAWIVCEGIDCEKYRAWFLRAWEDINRSAWEAMDRNGKAEPFCYGLPHERKEMTESPCEKCFCKHWCTVPCSQRLKWWDIQLASIRKNLGYEER